MQANSDILLYVLLLTDSFCFDCDSFFFSQTFNFYFSYKGSIFSAFQVIKITATKLREVVEYIYIKNNK